MPMPCAPTHQRPHPRCQGFTLVEVLIALMVMALLATLAWQGIDGMTRSRDASQARLDQTLRLNTVIGQWEQDLAALHSSDVVPALQFDGATLRLTRRAPGGVQVVAWSLRPLGTDGNVLLRWASPVHTRQDELQDSWLRSQQFQGTEPGQLRTLTQVLQWQVYFFRANAWTNAQSSGDVAPATPPPAPPASGADGTGGTGGTGGTAAAAPPRQVLPTGVRLQLEFAPGGANSLGISGPLLRDVFLGAS